MPFEINAKQFLLTYPQCQESKEALLSHLQGLAEISLYVVCKEQHQDGQDHLHACIKFQSRFHRTDPLCFDYAGRHPNIKVLKRQTDFNRAVEYAKKDGDYITNVEVKLGKRQALALKIIEEGRITPKLVRENPEVIFLNHASVRSWLQVLQTPPSNLVSPPKKRHIWLTGVSNSGKTTWLRAFLAMSDEAQEIPDNNDYQRFSYDTQIAWADEYRGQLTIQSLNRLCDGMCSLNTKGSTTHIGYLRVVICSNFSISDCYNKSSSSILDTLYNRFDQYDATYKLPKLPCHSL